MANTYTEIHLHIVFVVKYREALIHPSWENKLHSYIVGIVKSCKHKPLIINGVEDHIHLLIGMRPEQSLSDLMKLVKGNSSKWINENHLTKKKFEWQAGYVAFSYSKSALKNVINYIANQKEHHQKVNFNCEYIKLLNEFEIDYDARYVFKEVE